MGSTCVTAGRDGRIEGKFEPNQAKLAPTANPKTVNTTNNQGRVLGRQLRGEGGRFEGW